MIKTTTKNKATCNTISAPTLEKTIEDPEQIRTFYDQLSSIINKMKNWEVIIIGGDFNAKTKIDQNIKILGRCARSKINKNGEKVIEFYSLPNLRITNTLFKHKPIQQTNWQSPAPYKKVIDAETKKMRRNSYIETKTIML